MLQIPFFMSPMAKDKVALKPGTVKARRVRISTGVRLGNVNFIRDEKL